MKFFTCCVWSLFSLSTTIYANESETGGCLEKEKALTSLEIVENLLTKTRNTFPDCNDDANSTDQSECGNKKPLSYIEISKKLISDVRKNFPKCSKSVVEYENPKDCSEILASGSNKSGVYTVWPREPFTTRKPLQVYCDMNTDRGGWTMIQRRGKFPIQQDFFKDWESYKNGFGNISEEFWLGNENIRVLCDKGCEIRFDLQLGNGLTGFAHYKSFTLSTDKYRISISGYTGTVGDSMKHHNGFHFSTKDNGKSDKAEKYQGGWWFMDANGYTNLNGIYQPGKADPKSVFWWVWKEYQNLAKAEIKVRPK